MLVGFGIATALVGGADAQGDSKVRARPDFKVGITTYSWDFDDPNSLFSDMKEVGLRTARLSLYRENTDKDLATLQSELPNAQANGVDVSINLMQAAQIPIEGYSDWAGQMAAQLPTVKRFIIHNEVNTKNFWEGTLKDYVDTLHDSYLAIKAVRPDAVVSGFGLLLSQPNAIAFLKQADKYARAKYGSLKKIMDRPSVHIYNESPWAAYNLIQKVEAVWKGPINIDEVGWQGTDAGQAQDEIDFIKLVMQDPQVQSVNNYPFRDYGQRSDLGTGLERADGSKRLLYWKLKTLLAQQK